MNDEMAESFLGDLDALCMCVTPCDQRCGVLIFLRAVATSAIIAPSKCFSLHMDEFKVIR